MYQHCHIPHADFLPGKDFPVCGTAVEPEGVNPQEYPQLRRLIWDRIDATFLTMREAFGYYESSWRFVDEENMDAQERNLLEYLIVKEGRGVFLG